MRAKKKARNEGRPGYKKTKVGWIPKEWNAEKLGMHVGVISGNSPAVYNPGNSGAYPFVKVDDMNLCSIYQSSARLYSSVNKSLVPEGAIIFAKRGAAIATNKVRIAACPLVMDSNMMALVAKDSMDYLFLYYSILKERLWKIADTSTVPQINNKHIKPYKIPLPPLPEQKKIAKILSAWDRAIEQVGKLIDAKERLKKGLMQQLLTGRMRFAGFGKPVEKKGELPEWWQEVRLGECLSKIVGGGTPSRDKAAYWDGPIPWATVKDISSGSPEKTIECITEIGLQSSSANLIPRGVNIVATRMAVGVSIRFECDVAINQDLKALFTKQDMLCDDYLHWILRCSEARLGSLGGGSTVSGIRLDDLKKLKITLPILPEQIRIAAVLSSCDREIELLRKKLEKLKEQKKGLMHKLLTGEVRVKI